MLINAHEFQPMTRAGLRRPGKLSFITWFASSHSSLYHACNDTFPLTISTHQINPS